MTKNMFEDIKDACEQANVYFKWRQNVAGVWGLAPVQKVTAALRMLAYGGSSL
jgi:cell division protein FtsW (lipid II flippase)